MKKILFVFAHPDDESFTCGGTAAKYVSNGWDIELVCASRGEAGSRGDMESSSLSTGDIRQKELEKTIKALGIRRITFLGYKDGLLTKLAPGELEETIYKILIDRKPHIVVTFEPNGITNHPDHKRLTIATTYAFQKYARSMLLPPKLLRRVSGRSSVPKELVETISDAEKPRLYYSCIPEGVVAYLQKAHVLPRDSYGALIRGLPDDSITTNIDISRFAKKKALALASHQSQKAKVDPFLVMPNNPLAKHEYFILRMIGIHEYYVGKNDRASDRLQ